MKILKKILLVFAALFLVMQFIRPPRNVSTVDSGKDISTLVPIPADVQTILRTSCYDCHSNTTMYPWYAEIQPVGWFLNGHIEDAKSELNFSEFSSYRPRRQMVKLTQIGQEVESEAMPLPSYLILHTEAVLSETQKQALYDWVEFAKDSLRSLYPPDSLRQNG
jgi:hypothetical protein